ncbi:cytochrome bd oxidase small subunit CydS [Gracilibacillus alcaliphilus]
MLNQFLIFVAPLLILCLSIGLAFFVTRNG